MKRATQAVLVILCIVIFLQIACKKADTIIDNLESEWLNGGSQTAFDQGSSSFSHMFSGMSALQNRVHEVGDGQFSATFVAAPAPLNPGLGPIYNNVACVSCHVSDGRGKVPGSGESAANMLFRISLPGIGEHGNPVPIPGFGDQLQSRSVLTASPEGDVSINYTEQSYNFADGDTYSLRTPHYTFINLYMPMPSNALLSPRVAAPVFGLGLLEAVSEEDILKMADPNDANKDGIKGQANYVWDVLNQKKVLGRFGWKANQPSILQQVAAAYNGDMGITNYLFPKESSEGQTQFSSQPGSKTYELADSLLYSVEFYVKSLAVPVRRDITNPAVVRGKALFTQTGCIKCHAADLRTKVNVAFPQVSNQLIHPFTDLLLHDMGDGLADNRPDFLASGKQWRTAPLWGIGLTQKVNGHTNFLHDGRARNLMEAVMWHGGEALAAKNNVVQLSRSDRASLIAFLESL
ncbi:di-heme oxidoredictase family protein [Pedobacter sp.]|jgi:CxxC motif-containing protein (DUF1111 family)|uniref:di-heme oxidoreductase family protein n=1 Tax=Pedobacter sp. TaxID=1411316 RepID=UPI002C4A8BBA|nr:di-heme oxidoredictase family protein [Pedobacter sp.]HWW42436.1 di-heme oxidoredictase family protein [Pedobacter sp.]